MTNPPLHVWVLSAEYQPYIIGGLGVVATALTRELAQMGVRVTVISSTPRSSVSIARGESLAVVRFPKGYSARMMAKYLEDHHVPLPDVIHAHSLQYVGLLQHYRLDAKVPAVYTCHSLLRRKVNKVYTPQRQLRLLRSADHIVVPSTLEQDKLLSLYPFCAGKTSVIGHGVKIDDSGDRGVGDSYRYRLLYAGRLVRNKGLEELIDAMVILKPQYPQARLDLIGDGTISARLKHRASRRGVANIVQWLGRYDHQQLQSAYRNFGAVIMPSKAESFGLVALEALAAGVPLVATQAGGLGEFISSEVAQVIKQVDAPTIAGAIAQMWQSPALTRQRVRAGRELALSYQWSHAARSYGRLFAALAAATEGGGGT